MKTTNGTAARAFFDEESLMISLKSTFRSKSLNAQQG